MSKEMSVIALGIFVAVVPYLGIPGSWKTPLFVLCGLALALIGFLMRGEALSHMPRRMGQNQSQNESHPFVENSQTPAPVEQEERSLIQ